MKTNINFSYLVFLSVVAALGGFLFGYDAAVISGTISQVTTQFRLDQIQTGWFVGCALVGSIIGVLFAGKLSDRYGRKITMLIAALFFSVSGIGCAFAGGFDQLVVARVLGGRNRSSVYCVTTLYIRGFYCALSGAIGVTLSIGGNFGFSWCLFGQLSTPAFLTEWCFAW